MGKESEDIIGEIVVSCYEDHSISLATKILDRFVNQQVIKELEKLLKLSSVHAGTTKVLGTVRAEIVFTLEQLKQK